MGHAAATLPAPDFDLPQHGKGVWAPSLRHHDGFFWIYVGDPDRGVFMTRARDPRGPWEPLHLLQPARGWIDPCPLWDDDGTMYLVHAWAKSRAGFNGVLSVRRLTPDGRGLVGEETRIFDGDAAPSDDRGPEVLQARRLVLRVRAGGRRGRRLADGAALAERARALRGPHRARPRRHRDERAAPGRVGGDGARRLVPPLPGPRRLRAGRAPAAVALARRLARHRTRRRRRRPGRAGAGRSTAGRRGRRGRARRRATPSTATAWDRSGSGRRTHDRSGRRSPPAAASSA